MRYAHGTPAGYSTGGCRCPDCREAKRVYQQQWRDKTKRWRRRHVRTEAELVEALSKPEVFWW